MEAKYYFVDDKLQFLHFPLNQYTLWK